MEPFVAKTTGATVSVYPSKVVIKYGKILGSGMGEKEIRIKSITGVHIKKPGLLAGYIEFIFSGGKEATGSIFKKDENRLIINGRKQYQDMLKVKELIEYYMDQHEEGKTQVAATSQADELAKFAKLRDEGIITQEEFEAKKKQLLGM